MDKGKTDPLGLEDIRPGTQMCVISGGEIYLRTFSDTIDKLTRIKGQRGILISTLWSANALSRRISMSKLPRDSLKVIDTLSLSLGSKLTPSEDFIFLSTPISLESILVEVERLIGHHGSKFNFLVVDSLSFLSKYFTFGQMSEFFHFMLNRMLEEEMILIVFDQTSQDRAEISLKLSSITDRTVDLREGGDEK